MAYDVANFEQEVIQASYSSPVLVDFWAEWCGPCRILGPVLEKLAVEQADRWKLAKVNTEEHQQIAMQYGIRGIPNVKLFVDGEVVNEFTGALPEHQVRKWLDEAIPSEEAGILQDAQEALEAGDLVRAKALLEGVLSTDPEHATARTLKARLVALENPMEALALLEGIEVADGDMFLVKESVTSLAQVYDDERLAALPEAPVKSRYIDAAGALKDGDYDKALQHFIEVIMKDRYFDDDGSRKVCIALFSLLGPAHPTTKKHRRTFDMALY